MNAPGGPVSSRRKFRVTPRMVIAYLCLIPVSIGIGFGAFGIITLIKKQMYDRPLPDAVTQGAKEADIPPHAVYAVMYVYGDMSGGSGKNGDRIGYMGLSKSLFETIGQTLLFENPDPGLVYDPETNVRYGIAYLGYLFDKYLLWDTAFAAYVCGTDRVDAWLRDEELTDKYGALRAQAIPDRAVSKTVSRILSAMQTYDSLYKEN